MRGSLSVICGAPCRYILPFGSHVTGRLTATRYCVFTLLFYTEWGGGCSGFPGAFFSSQFSANVRNCLAASLKSCLKGSALP